MENIISRRRIRLLSKGSRVLILPKGPTLLLNADYNPLSVINLSTVGWKDAMRYMVSGTATVLETYSDWVVHSAFKSFNVPSVLVLNEYYNIDLKIDFNFKNILFRDDFKCQYCNQHFRIELLTKDHVVPKKFGGKAEWDNIVLACRRCNSVRGHNVNIVPNKKPFKPSKQFLEKKFTDAFLLVSDKTWIPYLTHRWEKDKLLCHDDIDEIMKFN